MEYSSRKEKRLKRLKLAERREDISLLSIGLIQFALLCIMAVAVYFGENTIAVILFCIVLFGVLGRIWADLSVKKLSVHIKAEKTHMFPDERTKLIWQMRNEKFFPVLWVDILQPLHRPLCMVPVDEDGSVSVRKMTQDEKSMFRLQNDEAAWLFKQRCSMVGAMQTAGFETLWRAQRRGIYSLDNTRIYTGDGFGMVRYRLEPDSGSQRSFVVYPRIVPVDGERFLKYLWEGESSGRGITEDLSLIKSTRTYQNIDSMKRINWRLLAKSQEMLVNQYEIVSPQSLHFIFDGESFRGRDGEKALEDTLEVLASLLLCLDDKHMKCGFSFPKTDSRAEVNLFADDFSGGSGEMQANVGEILYNMAAYSRRRPRQERNKETGKEEFVYYSSAFNDEELLFDRQQAVKFYFVTYTKAAAAECGLLKKMGEKRVEVLTYDDIKKLKKGTGEND